MAGELPWAIPKACAMRVTASLVVNYGKVTTAKILNFHHGSEAPRGTGEAEAQASVTHVTKARKGLQFSKMGLLKTISAYCWPDQVFNLGCFYKKGVGEVVMAYR